MDGRERILNSIDRQPVDRVAIFESFWWETEAEWRTQGLPQTVAAEEFFELDAGMVWFDQSFMLPLSSEPEGPDSQIVLDEWGARQILFTEKQSTPGYLGFAVETREQWEGLAPRLAYGPGRIDWDAFTARAEHLRRAGRCVMLSVLDPFECTWHKVGPEAQLLMTIRDPEWLTEMYEADTALIEAAFEEIGARGLLPDVLWIFGDIAYGGGMLFSPKAYRALLQPFHTRLCELGHRYGCRVVYHSDGDLTRAIPLLLKAGIDCLHPMEVKAGMDVLSLKEQYGDRLAFMGNIDARLFQANDCAGLEAEIRQKVPAATAGGGYIFHSDHSIPPGTRLDTYRFAHDLALEISPRG